MAVISVFSFAIFKVSTNASKIRSSTKQKENLSPLTISTSQASITNQPLALSIEDIEKDGYIEEARELYGARGGYDMNALLEQNRALFAGGELSQEQKDAYFSALMEAYVMAKEGAKAKFGRKSNSDE